MKLCGASVGYFLGLSMMLGVSWPGFRGRFWASVGRDAMVNEGNPGPKTTLAGFNPPNPVPNMFAIVFPNAGLLHY